MNLSEIKTLIETNTIQELEEKEKALLLLIENKDDIQEEGETMSNILAAKTILLRAKQKNTKPQLELRSFFKSVRIVRASVKFPSSIYT